MNKLNNLARKIDNCNTENQIVTQLVHKKMNETLVARSSETPRSTKTINIDDLQWADTLSLETIELLCRDNKTLNLLLIIACRDGVKKAN